MAAFSGGEQWSGSVKTLMDILHTSYNKSDLTELVKTILRSKEGILNHDDEHDNFYMCFAALAAQYLSNSANYVPKSGLTNIIKSCRILIELFLNRLQNYNEQCCLTQEELLLLINGLCKGGGLLARIDVSSLTNLLEVSKPPPSASESSVTVEKPAEEVRDVKRARLDPCSAILDQLMTPLHEMDMKSNKSQDKSDEASDLNADATLATVPLGFKNLFAAKNMVSLQQLNAGDVLINMCLKLPHLQPYVARYKDATDGKPLLFPNNMSDAQAIRSTFQPLLNNIKIVHLVLNLSILEPLHDKRLETLCKVVMSCVIAAVIVSVTNSILTMTTSNSSKTSASRDDDLDNCAFGIVKKSLEIFQNGSTAVHSSTRAGGHNLQNFQMIGAWCLLSGLQHTLCMTPPHATLERGKDAAGKPQSQAKTPEHQSSKQVKESISGGASSTASGRQSLLRVQQGFGALTVGLANQTLQLLVSLLEDLQVEMVLPDTSSLSITSEGVQVDLDIQGRYTARQRIQKLLSSFNITNLFFNLAAISYRKACMLKRVQRHLPDETYSTSESSSCCPDDISWSGDSSGDEDDDSEPILGHWFEETVAPKEVATASNSTPAEQQATDYPFNDSKDGRAGTFDSGSLIPDKAEPHGFISLASSIYDFMNQHILNSENSLMLNYGSSSLGDQHMIILAGIIRDLDRETSRGASCYGCAVNKLYEAFSHAIAKYSHNLLATGALSESLQNLLLVQLGVFPGQLEDWPLQVYPRTLAIMAQIFLLRQQREKEEMKTDSETACVLIWQKFIQMLQKKILNPTTAPPAIGASPATPVTATAGVTASPSGGVTVGPTTSGSSSSVQGGTTGTSAIPSEEIDDLNVEHAQLLLFLFHLLQLMQKKAILLECAKVIINVSKVNQAPLNEEQLLLLSRLLLIFEYLVKNLYEAPPTLIEQIQSNLFNDHHHSHHHHHSAHAQSLTPSPDIDKDNNGSKPKKLYIPCKDIEENYNQHCDSEEAHGCMKPRFYNLVAVDVGNQDGPKLDGFSSNFLLGTADILCYSKLYQSLIDLLGVGQQWDLSSKTGDKKLSYLGLCAVQYCFTITWRLLLSLPPSVSFLQMLATTNPENLKATLPLSLIWVPRISHKSFPNWHKDCLVRQGLTTQKAETLLRTISKNCDLVTFDVAQAKSVFQSTLLKYPNRDPGFVIPREQLPQLFEICLLDSVLAKLQVAFDDAFSKPSTEIDPKAQEVVGDFFPDVLQLIELVTSLIRSSLLYQMNDSAEPPSSFGASSLAAHGLTICLSSSRCPKASVLATAITTYMPMPLRNLLGKWNENSLPEFPAISAWRNAFANDPIPSESYVRSIQMCHVAALSSQRNFNINLSLKHTLHALVRFVGDLAIWCQDSKFSSSLVDTLFPLIMNACTENLADFVTLTLERIIGTSESDDYMERVYYQTLSVGYVLVNNHSNKESGLKENIFQDILKFIESMLDKAPGKKALARFFCHENHEFSILLLSTLNKQLSATYDTKVLQLFNKLFQLAEKNSGDEVLSQLCASVGKLSKVTAASMQEWLEKMVCGPPTDQDLNQLKENRVLLQNLVSHIVKENSHVGEDVATAILEALVAPMQTQILHSAVDGTEFPELMGVMATLAESGSGGGHISLIKRAIFWLHLCKNQLFSKEAADSLDTVVASGKLSPMMESVYYILSYLVDVFGALRPSSDRYMAILRCGMASPAYDGDLSALDGDSDWADELCQEEEDSAGEDSDEDSLSNKLCTFTITRKEFMNQHWYHCHTCKMVDGVGVCTTCAKVCHKDHDVTYAKFGSFFCDCGAKEDGSCVALVKRTATSGNDVDALASAGGPSPFSSTSVLHSSLRRRSSSPVPHDRSAENRKNATGAAASLDDGVRRRQVLAKQLDPLRENIFANVSLQKIACSVFDLLQNLEPIVGTNCYQNSPVGSNARIQGSLRSLHESDQLFETSDQLMVPTLGSQEGAFENVRLTYSGDQGQTIRQLIGVHVIRRVAMCVLDSLQGKRQHLAVSHEKGKITILQLSSLLKQTDSSKRKLTLTRLASAPVPFTVLSIAGNPCNEEFLAVCGLKDCHVLTFTPSGAIADHLVLQPQPAIGNFIIKAVWLPGSQTELALVMPDFVKIFDLAVDVVKPNYYFLLPSSKIRDCCFAFLEDGQRHLLLMSSSGHIYTQPLCEESTAKHGPFYVTNVLEVKHSDLKDSNSQIGGGGVSIYFSHALQLLFFSYAHGKSYISPFPKMVVELDRLMAITFKTNGGGKPNNQPLCQWSEIPNHPGLVCCLTQTNNNPVILMVKPDVVLVQEIKVLPAKAKITDMVAVRHQASGGEMRTTIILLCEDGSLRIYMANVDQTNFWLTPAHQPPFVPTLARPTKKKKAPKLGRPSGSVAFPVDFFEHCQAMSDVEFGGNDVLQVYNTQQIKQRLLTTGMYVASTKPAGFTIDITNSDSGMVMTGVRVMVGSLDIQKAPTYIEIFNRSVQLVMGRSRWFDFPFTQEESMQADKKISVFFGANSYPSGVTMVDSIKVYGKTKDAFGWPEDTDEPSSSPMAVATPSNGNSAGETESAAGGAPASHSSLDRLLAASLELLDHCFSLLPSGENKSSMRPMALGLATQLLTLPTTFSVQQQAKCLLMSLLANRVAYHNHKDQALLASVASCLKADQETPGTDQLDVERFYNLVVTARSVAVARPHNLVRFADTLEDGLPQTIDDASAGAITTSSAHGFSSRLTLLDPTERRSFLALLMDSFWKLHDCQPCNPALAPVSQPGLCNLEIMVQALVDIMPAFATCDLDKIELVSKLYTELLLCENPAVSFVCKQALTRALRPRYRRRRVCIPSPPTCEFEEQQKMSLPLARGNSYGSGGAEERADEGADAMALLPDAAAAAASILSSSPLEALLAGHVNFQPMLDIPSDADDETMVELAIALSLQEHGGFDIQDHHVAGLQAFALGSQARRTSSLERAQFSDTTASAGVSDDEGSTAATDGSTLRTPPAEQGGSVESESGGSGVDSITGEHNVSGRSSANGDNIPESTTTGARSETSSVGLPSTSMHPDVDGCEAEVEAEIDTDTTVRLHTLRLLMLEKFLQHVPRLSALGGIRAIPFLQVIIMLATDLDCDNEKDRAILDNLLKIMINELEISTREVDMSERTARHEVQLVIMRLLSVLMSRTKSTGGKSSSSAADGSVHISNATAGALINSGVISFCLHVLKSLLEYWKSYHHQAEDANAAAVATLATGASAAAASSAGYSIGQLKGSLLRPRPTYPLPNMSPFFLRQYVKGHANDVFEAYPQLLTEMVLRLPYQIKKIADGGTATIASTSSASLPAMPAPVFEQAWFYFLCEHMMTQQTPFVRKQVRKLLLFICGSKERYRQLRDLYVLESNLKEAKVLCAQGGYTFQSGASTTKSAGKLARPTVAATISLPYDSLISLIEQLKASVDIATSRTSNWQLYCETDESVLPFLLQVSYLLDEGVSPVCLQLLQCALCNVATPAGQASAKSRRHAKQQLEAEKTSQVAGATDAGEGNEDGSVTPEEETPTQCAALVQQVNKYVDHNVLSCFIKSFLLESNQSAVRWQAHSLVLSLFTHSTPAQQEVLLELMWRLWPQLPSYVRKAAQFVDLLGYFAIRLPPVPGSPAMHEYVDRAIGLLREQNRILAYHPNGALYTTFQGLVEFDGYYLESEPCLVCNDPEVPLANAKLSALKMDSCFTTTTQIVKLVGSHVISRIVLRVGDLKRAKMVRTVLFHYNNRSVQAVVELKNRPAMWHRARRCTLAAGQSELKVEFPLPIVACNLMIEYVDFYENVQASSETLQCPRCSASVPANPGVCANCGENVFQCHKCRAINYDEKDPFLCNTCGFCKYAKFDYTLTVKPCCAVDPIENEEDRKKAVALINTLLEKADRLYRQLLANKPILEAVLARIGEHSFDGPGDDSVGIATAAAAASTAPASSNSSGVNKAIQQLAQRYCGDCKSSYEELGKIIQKVLATRKELVEYDRHQKDSKVRPAGPSTPVSRESLLRALSGPSVDEPQSLSSGKCYGCASAATEHCITLLRALATNGHTRQVQCGQGLIRELVDYNLRRGSVQVCFEVRQLLCLLTRDNLSGTEELNSIIMEKVTLAIRSQLNSPDFASSVHHEMALLASSVQRNDSCWEQRLRCVLNLFLLGVNSKSPVVMETITVPCLCILQSLIRPSPPTSKKNRDKLIEALSTVEIEGTDVRIDLRKWLNGDPHHSFAQWKLRVPPVTAFVAGAQQTPASTASSKKAAAQSAAAAAKKEVTREHFLVEKYGNRWRHRARKDILPVRLVDSEWLRHIMFNPPSHAARQEACNMVGALCVIPTRKKEILDLLTTFLEDLGKCGESAAEFLALYESLIKPAQWKSYLAIRNVLPLIGNLITKEISYLTMLEETTLKSDLSEGYALKMLTELLASFIEQDNIRRHYKSRLVGTVLNGYLSLRKLVIQRTKLVDDTQEKLLELLEEMTTGNEAETQAFMSVCVETVKKYPLDDFRTPVFIFERLCSMIYPEENDMGEFLVTLEKDPQQEDFLQGRMLGNPYSSNEPGLGPLMRDIKNKVCQDCELVALLEDDNGMELLVNNKIISLDLPVKEVYKRVWLTEGGSSEGLESMRIMYRMRGLLGDATEEFIESLDARSSEEVDSEEVYKMANWMAHCGGIEVMLERLQSLTDLNRGRPLLTVILKLFGFCAKVKSCRQALIRPQLGCMRIMLAALRLALGDKCESLHGQPGGPVLIEQLLLIMETVLVEASSLTPAEYAVFTETCGNTDDIEFLLGKLGSPVVKNSQPTLLRLTRVLPFLVFANPGKLAMFVKFFEPCSNFNCFDFDHTANDDLKMECLCLIANNIECNPLGTQLKDMIVEAGIVRCSLEYIQHHAPPIRSALLLDSDELKEFISKPALKYILRFLTGMAHGHESTQSLVSADCIPIFHRLEQVSSDEHVGSLAENLMEALRENAEATKKIEEVRRSTRAEKKRLAMAMREKQLAGLGMSTNEKGQVTAKSSMLQQMEELGEESGLVCVICREGYRFQATKVLGIYTYTKRCNAEEMENKQRKTAGFTTVTHFNVVHVDCHMSAVRLARGRDEWESAALQNANTRCNGLLPLWGPQVADSVFASCLARHNAYLQECTGYRDIGYPSTVHDLKLLILRFANEKSFSEDSGGGGPQSNLHLIPYIIHMALYVINTTRAAAKEDKNLNAYLELPLERLIENSFEADGPLYWTTLALCVQSNVAWRKNCAKYLKKLLVLAHVRSVVPPGATRIANKQVKDYGVYKSVLIFFGIVHGLYTIVFPKVPSENVDWPTALADYIRNNDQQMLEAGDKLLTLYQDELLPCQTLNEFCDVVGLLGEIPDLEKYLSDDLLELPS